MFTSEIRRSIVGDNLRASDAALSREERARLSHVSDAAHLLWDAAGAAEGAGQSPAEVWATLSDSVARGDIPGLVRPADRLAFCRFFAERAGQQRLRALGDFYGAVVPLARVICLPRGEGQDLLTPFWGAAEPSFGYAADFSEAVFGTDAEGTGCLLPLFDTAGEQVSRAFAVTEEAGLFASALLSGDEVPLLGLFSRGRLPLPEAGGESFLYLEGEPSETLSWLSSPEEGESRLFLRAANAPGRESLGAAVAFADVGSLWRRVLSVHLFYPSLTVRGFGPLVRQGSGED